MKPLPPTLRENRRYVLARIRPPTVEADERDWHIAISEAVSSLYGDIIAAEIHAGTIRQEGAYLIIRCRRGWEEELSTALTTVRGVHQTPVHLQAISTSGTIKALTKKIRPVSTGDEVSCVIDGRDHSGIHYTNGNIDLIRRDMKGQEVVFLTKEDMESFHATTTKSDGI
ncbi:ribonuclease P/MRP protein subunit POP5 [Methanocalculus alkaliphilus]|uniref:Rpp14/Pop5 family protein n=1 Tax=Methanocalculus alkaliphilus TaxID=768730 RepID=UPI00209E7D70|nr:Rpp14/Pop5 family protein [Methanocalculus alkaliphilus]MCP1715368.1 ribonuclease P/MRP protein subunit POP5 [Methanocalculus alkaliphilus]